MRHVSEHLLICRTAALPIAALFLATIGISKLRLILIGLVTMTSIYVDHTYLDTSTGSIIMSIGNTYSARGTRDRQTPVRRPLPRGRVRRDDAALPRGVALPLLPGTSDIYSYEQTALIASGNTWDPRPVIQSYSAYGPSLARMNREHLEARRLPTMCSSSSSRSTGGGPLSRRDRAGRHSWLAIAPSGLTTTS